MSSPGDDPIDVIKESINPRALLTGGISFGLDQLKGIKDGMTPPEVEEDPLVKKQAEIGAKEWERYKQDFAPKEAEFQKAVTGIGSNTEREFLQGLGESRRQQESGPIQSTNRVMPLLGRALLSNQSKLPEQNQLQSKARKAKGLETAISLGRDIGTGSLNRIGRQAQINTSKNIASAEAAGIKQQGMADAAGTVAGIGLQRYFNKNFENGSSSVKGLRLMNAYETSPIRLEPGQEIV